MNIHSRHFYSFRYFCVYLGFCIICFGCKKEDLPNCQSDNFSDVIIGRWEVFQFEQSLGRIEFKSDGTQVDPDQALYITFPPQYFERSFVIPNDSTIHLMLLDTTSHVLTTTIIKVLSYGCDEVIVKTSIFNKTLVRR